MTRSEGADVGIEDRYGVVVIDQPWNRFRCRARSDA
jgi:hypothetical protein